MSGIIIATFILGGYLLIDIYAFFGLDLLFYGNPVFRTAYLAVSVILIISFYKIFSDLRSNFGVRSPITNFLIGSAFAIFITKFIFSSLLSIQDAGRVILAVANQIGLLMGEGFLTSPMPARSWWITLIAAAMALTPFLVMIYGVTMGKYNYKVDRVDLRIADLPDAFNGFTIAQISDIHAGSFDSVKQVAKGVDLLRNQGADAIFFTGDLVNSHKDEIDPYLDVFRGLSAPYGMYSVTGNHDYYGAYRYGDPHEKEDYWDDFYRKHSEIGFTILNNSSIDIRKGDDVITIAGVENWGAGPFPKRGNLRRALEGIHRDNFTILMSHDPTHWDHHILPHEKHVHLTLSGHTHAMQFGINLPRFKWSPAQYRHKHWMGLYEEKGQYLYVNRGFGFLGFPGRVGMRPEITLFTLTNGN